MVKVPAHQLVLVGPGFLLDSVIKNQHLQSATAPGTFQWLFSKLKRPANIVAMEFQRI
jgi:hypothetical protein